MTEQDLREMSSEDLLEDYNYVCGLLGENGVGHYIKPSRRDSMKCEPFIRKEILRRLSHYNGKSGEIQHDQFS